MQEQFSSIYGLVDPRDDLVFYIGSSVDPQRRFVQHMCQLNQASNPDKNERILSIKKDGLEPGLLIIEECIPLRNSFDRERFWIQHYLRLGAPLTNQSITNLGMDLACRMKLTREDVARAGLDTSRYLFIDGRYWLSCGDSVALLSWLNGHQVDRKYMNNPVKSGKLHPISIGAINAYPFDELLTLVVQERRGRP